MLSQPDDRTYLLKALIDGAWANQYEFDGSPQEWIDFVPANYLNSTHPDAIFVQKLLIVLHNPTCRQILFGDSLKTVSQGKAATSTIRPADRVAILADRFGLTLNP